jgi:RsmE family RNA methyltransferase
MRYQQWCGCGARMLSFVLLWLRLCLCSNGYGYSVGAFSFSIDPTRKPVHTVRRGDTRGSLVQRRHWFSFIRAGSYDNQNVERTKDSLFKLPRLYIGSVPKNVPVISQRDDCASSTANNNNLPVFRTAMRVELSAEQSHYIESVLRLFKKKSNPLVRIFDGHSSEWLARCVRVIDDKDNSNERGTNKRRGAQRILVECIECLKKEQEQSNTTFPLPWLCVAPPWKKKDRLRWMMEKVTELSCRRIFFLDTDFSESSSAKPDIAKLYAYLIEAAEQSEQITFPEISTVESTTNPLPLLQPNHDCCDLITTPLATFLEAWSESCAESNIKLLICMERSNKLSVLAALQTIYNQQHHQQQHSRPIQIAFVVGPEGGWSPHEQEMIHSLQECHSDSVFVISLGGTVLRTETAAMTAIAAYALFVDSQT